MKLRSLTDPQIVKEDGIELGKIYQNQTNGVFVSTGADGTELLETTEWGEAIQAILAIPNEEGDVGTITVE